MDDPRKIIRLNPAIANNLPALLAAMGCDPPITGRVMLAVATLVDDAQYGFAAVPDEPGQPTSTPGA